MAATELSIPVAKREDSALYSAKERGVCSQMAGKVLFHNGEHFTVCKFFGQSLNDGLNNHVGRKIQRNHGTFIAGRKRKEKSV
jgi:hypothetical protein